MSEQGGRQKSQAATDLHGPRPPAAAWLASLATHGWLWSLAGPGPGYRSSNRILGHGCQALFKQQPADIDGHLH